MNENYVTPVVSDGFVRVWENAMAFVSFADCIRVEVRFTLGNTKPAEITLWYRKNTGSVTQANCDDAAALIDDAVANSWLPLLNAATTYRETYVRDMTTQISFQATVNTGSGVGTRVGTATDAHSAVLLMRKSGLVGRKANGRIYLPGGVNTDRPNTALWSTALLDAWEGELADTDALFTGAGVWTPIIASPTLRLAGNPMLTSTFPITAWVGSTNMAAYRDRSN